MKSVRCICGFPCKEALFNSYVGCTNPKCKWFDNDIIRDMKKVEEDLRRVFPGLP